MNTRDQPIDDEPPGELQVGEWCVAPALNQLSRAGECVRLEPKAIELLVLLAQRRGEVISREDLLNALWPGVIVGDNALTQVVTKLRKALGDTAREPTYIEAISKRGYRLIAAVERPNRPLQELPAAQTPTAPGRSRSALRRRVVAGALTDGQQVCDLSRRPPRP